MPAPSPIRDPDTLLVSRPVSLGALFGREWFLAVSAATSIAFFVFEDRLATGLADPVWLAVIFIWLFTAILGSILSVVRHADHLAARLGEPFGTLILTLSITAVEVMSISAVMLRRTGDPTLARDTLFAVIMIVLNGMVGVSLLAGGWRHREQPYNLQGANAYLSVIVPLAVLALVLPDFTQTTPGPTLSMPQETFLVLMSLGLYGAFLAIQSGRHRGYFTLGEADHKAAAENAPGAPWLHAALLIAYMGPVVFLAERLAAPIDSVIGMLKAPAALGGVVIAVLVATPEAIGATRAAFANQMQRSVNIFLGSVLSTIGLTIPSMIVISNLMGRKLVLGIQNANLVLLLLTLFVSAITFAGGRTNVLQGLVHVLLFLAYLLLVFQG